MWASVLGCTVLVLFTVLTTGKAEIYIVRVEGEPIISYKGGVDGFEATAVESDEKIDTTRYLIFFLFWGKFCSYEMCMEFYILDETTIPVPYNACQPDMP